jgi:hypothetical protein
VICHRKTSTKPSNQSASRLALNGAGAHRQWLCVEPPSRREEETTTPAADYCGRGVGEEATVVASSIGSGREACGIYLWHAHRPVGEVVPARARGPMGERKEALAGGGG